MKKQILNEGFRRMQKLAGLINENEFYGDYDEDSVKQMLIDAGKDPQEVDNFMDDEEGYFSWSNMTFDHQPTDEDIKNAFVDAFEEWATGGTNSLYDELPYELGEPHPSAVYPAGGAWHTLSTGTSIDIGEDPYHGQYPMLTIEEHEEVIELLNNYIEQYEENFGGTEYYDKDVVDLAKYIVQQHEKKISSLMMNENISHISKSDFKNMIREMVLAEAKKDEKEEEDVEIEDTETVDTEEMPTEETPQGNPDDILDSLKTALDGAKALGDEKLVDQIGNTITFYTRVHIVGQETDMN